MWIPISMALKKMYTHSQPSRDELMAEFNPTAQKQIKPSLWISVRVSYLLQQRNSEGLQNLNFEHDSAYSQPTRRRIRGWIQPCDSESVAEEKFQHCVHSTRTLVIKTRHWSLRHLPPILTQGFLRLGRYTNWCTIFCLVEEIRIRQHGQNWTIPV